MSSAPPSITQLLVEWSEGDRAALDQLTPLVYDELRRLARSYLRRERSDHTLQAPALGHEAYIRLVDQHSVSWKNRMLINQSYVSFVNKSRGLKRVIRPLAAQIAPAL